jgi:hypothetical protein
METDAATALLARCGLYVDVESQALICRSCKYALATANSQITTHLNKKHRVSKDLRLALMRSLRQPSPGMPRTGTVGPNLIPSPTCTAAYNTQP